MAEAQGATNAPGSSGGGASGVADSGGSEGADDTSLDTGADGGDGSGDGDGGEGGAAKTAAEKRYQLKWLGRDHDLSEKDLLERFSDEYEFDFHGLGGKPLMENGKPLKANWQRIVRAVQKDAGAAESARKANETAKQYNDRMQWGKQPENRRAFMQREMGVENYDQWILQEAGKAHTKRKEMVELSQTNPVEYERRLRADYEAGQKEMQESQSRLQRQQQGEQQREQKKAAFFERVGGELKKLHVPLNGRTREVVDQIMQDYAAVGAELTYPELAAAVRESYQQDVFGYLDAHDDESLLKVFGDKRRERLRRAEIERLKVQRKAAPPEPKPRTSPRTEQSGTTIADFMRRR